MTKTIEIPDCYYPKEPALVPPSLPTPTHTLYLSNLDNQSFLRFTIKYVYAYRNSIDIGALRISLSRVLVEFYPLAGRLRACGESDEKLEVDCSGEGALLAEGFVDLSVDDFLEGSRTPNKSWRKLLYRVEANSFVGVLPLVIQVTHLRCGGMILCTAFSHCLCDGIGTTQFLHAWAHLTMHPNSGLVVAPFHRRDLLKPRSPLNAPSLHSVYATSQLPQRRDQPRCLSEILQSQPLVPVSVTFNPSQLLHLKKLCAPSLKCTSFEVLAAHVWRSWIHALRLPHCLHVKLFFSVNARRQLKPELSQGFYGNGFVLACAEAPVGQLLKSNARYGVKLVQEAKHQVDDDYVRSTVDLLETKPGIVPDLSAALVISQWSKLGLEELDFGKGMPLHMGSLASEIYCLLLPVVGDLHAFTVLVSVPQSAADEFDHCLKNLGEWEKAEDGDRVQENGGKVYVE